MIIKLVTVELFSSWRLWVCAFIVALFAALIACVCAGDFSTARFMPAEQGPAGLINHALIYGGFNAPVVIGALSVLLTYVVDLRRGRYALWQLAGVGPRTIRQVVLLQAAFLGLAAFAVAILLAVPTLNLFLNTLSAPMRTGSNPVREVRLEPLEMSVAFVVFMAVVVLSALGAAGKASRTPILAAIRTPEVANAPLSKARLITSAVFAVLAIGALVIGQLDRNFIVFGVLLALFAFLPAAPWIAERVTSFWVGLIPRPTTSWFIARETAKYNVTRSHAGITFMVIASGLGIVTGYIGLWDDPDFYALALALFGAPIGLVLFAGAATIIMTAGHRRLDTTLLIVSGGTNLTALKAAAFEALIFTITTGIIALVIALPGFLWPMGSPLAVLLPIPFVLALGFITMLITTTAPVIQTRRNTPAIEMRRATM
ncbi:FtsX-like permease family protein [Paenarthrobacter sp. NPDC056912]|uniref:FtsX-like permease family protein n=1 Tax=Paenarthrobacter sp. NPDC056912 TaxID=3345965 RepID=UPI0036714E39